MLHPSLDKSSRPPQHAFHARRPGHATARPCHRHGSDHRRASVAFSWLFRLYSRCPQLSCRQCRHRRDPDPQAAGDAGLSARVGRHRQRAADQPTARLLGARRTGHPALRRLRPRHLRVAPGCGQHLRRLHRCLPHAGDLSHALPLLSLAANRAAVAGAVAAGDRRGRARRRYRGRLRDRHQARSGHLRPQGDGTDHRTDVERESLRRHPRPDPAVVPVRRRRPPGKMARARGGGGRFHPGDDPAPTVAGGLAGGARRDCCCCHRDPL